MSSQEKTHFNVYLSRESHKLLPDSKHVIEIEPPLFSDAYRFLVGCSRKMRSHEVRVETPTYSFHGRELQFHEGISQYGLAHAKQDSSHGFHMIRLRHTNSKPMGLARKVSLI